ncbi:MAG: Hsp20/alpha crystallin family protein [Candidatus Bathyarchaeota archaeon]|nr:Hsp20/alpha crystallin family protein [Candidatus Bathyarchaeota archaeon]
MSKKTVSEKSEIEEKELKPVLTPGVCFDHNSEAYHIQIELPGVKKEDVELFVSEQTMCVEGPREDVILFGCFTLAHLVNVDKAKANYGNGLLTVEIPLKTPVKGKKIKIE